MKACEYPGCDVTDEEDNVVDTFGFTVNGLVESERDYCDDHAPGSNVIDP